jgi:carbonic anhydrase/acetyltransferase-like protein (isoleucine patch superfamily)
MFAKKNKKYKLISQGLMPIRNDKIADKKMYQLQALRDIPKYGVKTGDLGGFVSNDQILSHDGSCWVADDAQVVGYVDISDDAYISEKSLVINIHPNRAIYVEDEAKIYGSARVQITRHEDYSGGDAGMVIQGNVQIYGESVVASCGVIYGNTKIHGNAVVVMAAEISDDADISGAVKLSRGVNISGKSILSGNAFIDNNVNLRNCIIGGNQQIAPNISLSGKELSGDGVLDSMTAITALDQKTIETPAPSATTKKMLAVYKETLAGIESYESDIVKIIKYPVMTDRTDNYTREMVKALNTAKRLVGNPEDPDFAEAVLALEDAYLSAESNALKVASTSLSEEGLKKADLARDMLAIASNEASSENEKKVSFKQAFKQLEGVIAVPELAVETFRVKIGLKELEG